MPAHTSGHPEQCFAAWRQRLVRSLHLCRAKPEAKFYQVSSVSSDGLPRNRSMVFRGFVQGSDQLLSISDTRSDKIQDWRSQATSEICWYFAKTREQYRLQAKVELVLASDVLRQASDNAEQHAQQTLIVNTWRGLSDAAKAQFLGASPKAPFDHASARQVIDKPAYMPTATASNDQAHINKDNTNAALQHAAISEFFCVVIFTPLACDYLNLRNEPQTRLLASLKADGTWQEQQVYA